jgi:glycosyltransferase involved in cell wall biosynthesis
MPLVSVIIPCFNQGQYLDESIGSVLASTFTDLEIIVVDDGSTDPETCRIIQQLAYPKTTVVSRANGGLASARNSGIDAAAGKYILPLDADDRIGPDYIRQAVAALDADAALGIVYCQAEKFGTETGLWHLPRFSRFRMSLGNVIFCSAVYRRDDWSAVGGYDPQLRRGWEDWEFWLSLLALGRRVYKLPQVGFYYRKSNASMAAGMEPALKAELHARLMKKHAAYLGCWSMLLKPLLPLYYRFAGTVAYRTVKRGMGR